MLTRVDDTITELLVQLGLLHGYPDDQALRTEEEDGALAVLTLVHGEMAAHADEDSVREAFAANTDRYRALVDAAMGRD